MSYILDALKKSEEARGNATPHEVELPELPALPSRRSGKPGRRRYIMAFLLILGVSFTVYRFVPRHRSGTTKPAPASSAPHPVALASREAPAAAKAPKAPPVQRHIRKPNPSRPSPAPRRVEVAAKKPPLPELSHGSTSQQSALDLKAARLKVLLEKQAARVRVPPGPVSPGQNLADIRSFAAPDASSQPRVSSFGRLPLRIRESLPHISVSMLVYSRQPADRFIYINGSKEHEGEQISPGLTLERITPDGAVFSYRGVRFYKSVIGN